MTGGQKLLTIIACWLGGKVKSLTSVQEAFAEYRGNNPAREPDHEEIASDDELRQLTSAEGLRSLAPPPCDGVVLGHPPYEFGASAKEKYLWAIKTTDVPYALEFLPDVEFKRGRLSHTNLTGGAPAHVAGELWFIDASSMVLNGGSGRYPPRSAEELMAAALSFKTCGFKIASMGWEPGTAGPRRFQRGALTWLYTPPRTVSFEYLGQAYQEIRQKSMPVIQLESLSGVRITWPQPALRRPGAG